jgi:3-isopropylmalate dehydrogenase
MRWPCSLSTLVSPQSAARIDRAVASVTGTKMQSQAAGRMGFSTSKVGDLVVAALDSPEQG